MTKRTSFIGVLLLASTFALAACGAKPKSSTTTRTQTTTTDDSGQKTSTDVKQTDIEQKDGSQSSKRTETTSKNTPAPAQ